MDASAAEPADPESVAEHDHRLRTRRLRLVRGERAADLRRHAEQVEVGVLHELEGHACRRARTRQVVLTANEESRRLERVLLVAQAAVFRVRPDSLPEDARRIALRHQHMHQHQPVGLAERQRSQHQRIHEREDRDRRADAHREHQHRDDGERRPGAKGAPAICQILSNRHGHPPPPRTRRIERGLTQVRPHDAGHLSPVPECRRANAAARHDGHVQRFLEVAGDRFGILSGHDHSQ